MFCDFVTNVKVKFNSFFFFDKRQWPTVFTTCCLDKLICMGNLKNHEVPTVMFTSEGTTLSRQYENQIMYQGYLDSPPGFSYNSGQMKDGK